MTCDEGTVYVALVLRFKVLIVSLSSEPDADGAPSLSEDNLDGIASYVAERASCKEGQGDTKPPPPHVESCNSVLCCPV